MTSKAQFNRQSSLVGLQISLLGLLPDARGFRRVGNPGDRRPRRVRPDCRPDVVADPHNQWGAVSLFGMRWGRHPTQRNPATLQPASYGLLSCRQVRVVRPCASHVCCHVRPCLSAVYPPALSDASMVFTIRANSGFGATLRLGNKIFPFRPEHITTR